MFPSSMPSACCLGESVRSGDTNGMVSATQTGVANFLQLIVSALFDLFAFLAL